jgi:hypothetical protein
MVGTVGLEPTRSYEQRILSPFWLPITAHPHMVPHLGIEPSQSNDSGFTVRPVSLTE